LTFPENGYLVIKIYNMVPNYALKTRDIIIFVIYHLFH
jgi:hypothetical protein